VKLSYNKLGYNKLPVITNNFFNIYSPKSRFTTLSNSVITNSGYNEHIWSVPSMFVVTKFHCIIQYLNVSVIGGCDCKNLTHCILFKVFRVRQVGRRILLIRSNPDWFRSLNWKCRIFRSLQWTDCRTEPDSVWPFMPKTQK